MTFRFTLVEVVTTVLMFIFWAVAIRQRENNAELSRTEKELRNELSEEREATMRLICALNLAVDIIRDQDRGQNVHERLLELSDRVKDLVDSDRFQIEGTDDADADSEWPEVIKENESDG